MERERKFRSGDIRSEVEFAVDNARPFTSTIAVRFVITLDSTESDEFLNKLQYLYDVFSETF